jgi:polar amino acid transport system substrate-binding protein
VELSVFRRPWFVGLTIIILLSCTLPVRSADFTATLAIMPQSAEMDQNGELYGAYVELIRGIDRNSGSNTKIIIDPFKRSIRNLVQERADFHIPLIRAPGVNLDKLPYAFSTVSLFQVSFVLYTNVSKPLELEQLKNYDIYTDPAHKSFFPFKVGGSSCLSCTIRSLDAGKIDGFIFAQNEIDPIIKEHKLINIRRQLYQNYDVKILIPKGEKGKKIDQFLSDGIARLRASGEYEELLSPVLAPYIDWQPTDHGALTN